MHIQFYVQGTLGLGGRLQPSLCDPRVTSFSYTEPNSTGSQHASLQAPFYENYSRTADSTFTSDLIWTCLQIHRGFYPVKLQNIQAGQHILQHRCHPISTQGTVWMPPWWHRTAGGDPSHPRHESGTAQQWETSSLAEPRGAFLWLCVQGRHWSHCTLPASPTAKLSQKGNLTHPE